MPLDLPPIPFSVYDVRLRKTVHVVSSCSERPKSVTVLVSETVGDIKKQVYAGIKFAFKTNGVTIVEVCRTQEPSSKRD